MVLLGTLEEEMRKRYRDDVQQTLSTHVLVLLQTLPSVHMDHRKVFFLVLLQQRYMLLYILEVFCFIIKM